MRHAAEIILSVEENAALMQLMRARNCQNSVQDNAVETGNPASSQGHLLPTAFLALLDLVIIIILLRYILVKRSQ